MYPNSLLVPIFFFLCNKMRRFPLEINVTPIHLCFLGSLLFLNGGIAQQVVPTMPGEGQDTCLCSDSESPT